MISKNPKCSNNNSFMYSITISLHYYELSSHPERIKQLNKYLEKYNLNNTEYNQFEKDNPSICLSVFNENNEQIYKPTNNSNEIEKVVKINNNRYHAIKPQKDKNLKLTKLLKSFTHEELTEYILSKLTF